jgi:hypothetical protein
MSTTFAASDSAGAAALCTVQATRATTAIARLLIAFMTPMTVMTRYVSRLRIGSAAVATKTCYATSNTGSACNLPYTTTWRTLFMNGVLTKIPDLFGNSSIRQSATTTGQDLRNETFANRFVSLTYFTPMRSLFNVFSIVVTKVCADGDVALQSALRGVRHKRPFNLIYKVTCTRTSTCINDFRALNLISAD